MTTRHAMIQFIAGDDWELQVQLLDENGNPYNLISPTILWRLYNQCGVPAINDEDVQINVLDAVNGLVSVFVPASATTNIAGGIYNDALRLILDGETGTLLVGTIDVMCDPWAATVPSTATVNVHTETSRSSIRNRLKLVAAK